VTRCLPQGRTNAFASEAFSSGILTSQSSAVRARYLCNEPLFLGNCRVFWTFLNETRHVVVNLGVVRSCSARIVLVSLARFHHWSKHPGNGIASAHSSYWESLEHIDSVGATCGRVKDVAIKGKLMFYSKGPMQKKSSASWQNHGLWRAIRANVRSQAHVFRRHVSSSSTIKALSSSVGATLRRSAVLISASARPAIRLAFRVICSPNAFRDSILREPAASARDPTPATIVAKCAA
jgi:hypothetical protein